MGQGGSGGSKSSSDPWWGQQPYLRDIYARAQGQYPTEMPFYPGETVAARDPATTRGLNAAEALAGGGAPGSEAALGLAQREVGGEYLGANPWLDSMYDRAAKAVTRNYQQTIQPGIDTSFAGADRIGSGAHLAATREGQRGLGEGLSNLAVDVYGGNYDAERARMGAAADRIPMLEAARYGGAERLIGTGAEREAYQQRLIEAGRERYEYGQQEPWQRLGLYSNAIGQPVMTSQAKSWGAGIGTQILTGLI